MKVTGKGLVILSVLFVLQGCNMFAYTNKKLESDGDKMTSHASFNLIADRGLRTSSDDKTLFILALSGGGSRAAYWSIAAMFKLQSIFEKEGIDLLAEVDAISAISGGSMAAAYYAVSVDPSEISEALPVNGYRPLWQEQKVKKMISRNFLARWFGNWFWPHNIAKFWFTAFDRTDIMAKTMADNLYDTSSGHDFTLGEINPERPNLILNATISSGEDFAGGFSYTQDDFSTKLCSDINDYEIARAVMGSAAFPAAFNSMTLRNYGFSEPTPHCSPESISNQEAFLHVIDGGSQDNLGLRSTLRFLKENDKEYKRIAVILIDAYTSPKGLSTDRANPRGGFDYIIDSNFVDSVNSLMDRNRSQVINQMTSYMHEAEQLRDKNVEFYHVTFESIPDDMKDNEGKPLKQGLFDIPTSFSITPGDLALIDTAADYLFRRENACLQKIVQQISGRKMPRSEDVMHGSICLWSQVVAP